MTYELFSRLYDEASDYEDLEFYIAERGWQDWMDDYQEADVIADLLEKIYTFAKSDFKTLRIQSGYGIKAFSLAYGIPERTVQAWEYGERAPADYLTKLLAYTMLPPVK